MTPWHKVPSEQQGWLVTVTWRVPWRVPGTAVQAGVTAPRQSLGHLGRAELPFAPWPVPSHVAVTRCPLPGTQCQHSSGSCFVPDLAGVSQAPGGCQALWASALAGIARGAEPTAERSPCPAGHPCGAPAAVLDLPEGFGFAGITQRGSGAL